VVQVIAPASVYLVRHSQTAFNAAGLLRGRLDPPLDSTGVAEAADLGRLFSSVGLVAIVTSPMQRAVQTADAMVEASAAALSVHEGLVDRDYGPWAGVSADEVDRRFGSVDGAPGVEPADVFAERVAQAVAAIGDQWAPGPVAVVAHDAVNRYTLARLVPAVGHPGRISQRTGCWNLLERRHDSWCAPIIDALPADGDRP
jgi:broad specificity phosphatase PhoE